MNLTTPCPRCQAPITLGQYLSNMSLTLSCRSCGAILRYKPWVWAVLAVVLLALIGALAGIGFDNILAGGIARGAMRLVFLTFVVLGLALSVIIFALRPFTTRD